MQDNGEKQQLRITVFKMGCHPVIGPVLIRGQSAATAGCAHLLRRAGLDLAGEPDAGRVQDLTLLLSDAALALLRDVFDRPDLFADRKRITRRIVAWGTGEPVAMPHGAVAIARGDLQRALETPMAPLRAADSHHAGYVLHGKRPFPVAELARFGSRKAEVCEVELLHSEDEQACWIEAVESGWLFMMPVAGPERLATLLAIGGPAELLLAESLHIAPRLELRDMNPTPFDTAPRMLEALQGENWLACGTAAIAFDPICGDGTALAARQAILAAAVIAAISEGGDAESLRGHYEAMLIAAMRRHLRACADFYRTGGSDPWWRAQLAALAEGFDWCSTQLMRRPEPRFELHGFRLVARDSAE